MATIQPSASDVASPPKKRRWLRYALIVVGMLLVVPIGLILLVAVPQLVGLATITSTKTTSVGVQIANLKLQIPRNIIDFPPETKKPDPAISLIVLWPTLEGRSGANMNEFMKVSGFGRRLRMLIQDVSNQATITQRFEFRRRDMGEIEWRQRKFDLVEGVQINPRDLRGASRYDLYVEGEIESPSSFLECSAVGAVPVPGCFHTFMHQGLAFRISYDRLFLPEWKNIQTQITNLFDGLIEEKL